MAFDRQLLFLALHGDGRVPYEWWWWCCGDGKDGEGCNTMHGANSVSWSPHPDALETSCQLVCSCSVVASEEDDARDWQALLEQR